MLLAGKDSANSLTQVGYFAKRLGLRLSSLTLPAKT
jgi:hypothetical protein